MTIRVLAEAKRELQEAVAYYDGLQPELGRRLWQEIDEHILWVSLHPEVARLRRGGYRRVNLRVFPYFIAYIVRGDLIWVLAIGHARRLPEYWIRRTRDPGP